MSDRSSCPQCGQPINIYMQSCPVCHADLTPKRTVVNLPAAYPASPPVSAPGSPPASTAASAPVPLVPPASPPALPHSPEGLIPRLGDILIEKGLIHPQQLQAALARQRESVASMDAAATDALASTDALAATDAHSQGKQVLLGQVLVENGWLTREALDEVITEQIMGLQGALKENNRQLEQRVQQRTGDLQGRLLQIRTAAEITHVAISAEKLDQALTRTVTLITERLKYHFASIYLINEFTGVLEIVAASLPASMERKLHPNTHDMQDPKTMVAWTAANRRARVAADVSREPLYWADPLLLNDTRSEAAILISLGEQVLGVLDVHSTWINAFDDEAVAVMQTIANHIAAVIQNFRLLEHTRKNLEQSVRLNETNHRLNLAQNAQSVFSEVVNYLKASPTASLLLVADGKQFRVVPGNIPSGAGASTGVGQAVSLSPGVPTDPPAGAAHPAQNTTLRAPRPGLAAEKRPATPLPEVIAVNPEKLLAQMPPGQVTFTLPRLNGTSAAGLVPAANTRHLQGEGASAGAGASWIAGLMRIHDWLECETITLIPIRQHATLAGVLALARPSATDSDGSNRGGSNRRAAEAQNAGIFQAAGLVPAAISLAEQATTTLEKLSAVENLQRQLSAMQSLDAISKAIAMETEPQALYRTIHHQMRDLLGDVDFVLAEYRDADVSDALAPGANGPSIADGPSIAIPYAYENGEELHIPMMPLGEGLTSLLIKTRQPLLLTGDVQQQALRLGARVVGQPAKSWMGVPLIVANQVIGAMILQDTRYENRFSETELRLVNTLSTQIAITMRNARLYQESSRLAEQERLAADLTTRVWSSPDIETILRVALEDLGSKLYAAEATIELDASVSAPTPAVV